MIQSMTGYGRAEARIRQRLLVVELRSVNHRYCDVLVKLPRLLASFEDSVRKKIQETFARGRIEVTVSLEGTPERGPRFRLDRAAARRCYQVLNELQREFSLPGEIDLPLFIGVWDRITVADEEEREAQRAYPALERILARAVARLEKMRRSEGAALQRDLLARLAAIHGAVTRVQGKETLVVEGYRKRLSQRVAEISGGIPLDPLRLSQEVALLVDRSDISEERVRLETHLNRLAKLLRSKTPVGRTVDFLLQEINREVNTIGSKANNAEIALEVVGIKTELEKIREQVQNIE
jgi:uncharacterized protein (TIGR00255 family)